METSDRHPPHAPDAESAIIGCCLSFPDQCLPRAGQTITPDHFYDLRNTTIWKCLNKLPLAEVSFVSVVESLRSVGWLEKVGGIGYLSKCQDLAIGPSFLNTWLETLVEKYTLRKLLHTCTEISSAVYTNGRPALELLDIAERDILKVRPHKHEEQNIKTQVVEALRRIEQKCETGDKITGISTGFPDLDHFSDGLHGGEMIVVAGYPSTGKTALALNMAVHAALSGIPSAVLSAEMQPVQLTIRAICSEARVNYHRASFNDAKSLAVPSGRIARAPLFIEPCHGMIIGQIASLMRTLKQKHGIKLAVIDYIQRLRGTGDNREQEIASISNGIKSIALELDCAILALSQLNDDGKLRESRAIGQDADSVWKLENDGKRKPLLQPINLHIEKCRDGEIGTVKLMFLKAFTRFESVSKIEPDYQLPHND